MRFGSASARLIQKSIPFAVPHFFIQKHLSTYLALLAWQSPRKIIPTFCFSPPILPSQLSNQEDRLDTVQGVDLFWSSSIHTLTPCQLHLQRALHIFKYLEDCTIDVRALAGWCDDRMVSERSATSW